MMKKIPIKNLNLLVENFPYIPYIVLSENLVLSGKESELSLPFTILPFTMLSFPVSIIKTSHLKLSSNIPIPITDIQDSNSQDNYIVFFSAFEGEILLNFQEKSFLYYVFEEECLCGVSSEIKLRLSPFTVLFSRLSSSSLIRMHYRYIAPSEIPDKYIEVFLVKDEEDLLFPNENKRFINLRNIDWGSL